MKTHSNLICSSETPLLRNGKTQIPKGICNSCKMEPKYKTYNKCWTCVKKNNNYNYKMKCRKSDKELLEFVDRINNRGGFCSISEMLIELIDLHNNYFRSYEYDKLKPNKQLSRMWKDLNTKVDKIRMCEKEVLYFNI
jgi:hypothetical protein